MKPQLLRNMKLLMLLICFNLCLSPNSTPAAHYEVRDDFIAAVSSYTNIDFEGIAEQSGQAYPLDAYQFADYGITIDFSYSVGTPSVGEPVYSPPDSTFWSIFNPTSPIACIAPDITETPKGVIAFEFNPPVMGVGANFLNVNVVDSYTGEKNTSKILVHGDGYDEYWEATGEGDQFISIVDPLGRIEIAYFYIGYIPPYSDPNGAAIDDLIIGQVAIEVNIDIKPGSTPNTINLGSNGVIPVAILSSEDFDATQVDPETVELAGSGVAMRGKSNKYLAHQEDVNDDGLIDLVCQVETENLNDEELQEGYAILTGNLLPEFGGTPIEGSDEITIVPPSEPE